MTMEQPKDSQRFRSKRKIHRPVASHFSWLFLAQVPAVELARGYTVTREGPASHRVGQSCYAGGGHRAELEFKTECMCVFMHTYAHVYTFLCVCVCVHYSSS